MNSVENFGNGSKYQIKYVELSDMREESPFKDLFEIKPDDSEAIENHMSEHGYDGSQPIIVWKEKGIVIDGHTRLKAVKNLQANIKLWRSRMKGFDSIPIIELPFETEEEALDYAIHNQTERRNLTEWDILKLVEKVDKRSSNWGGIRKGNGVESSFGNPKVDSRERTAQIVGTSKDKVDLVK